MIEIYRAGAATMVIGAPSQHQTTLTKWLASKAKFQGTRLFFDKTSSPIGLLPGDTFFDEFRDIDKTTAVVIVADWGPSPIVPDLKLYPVKRLFICADMQNGIVRLRQYGAKAGMGITYYQNPLMTDGSEFEPCPPPPDPYAFLNTPIQANT